MDAKSRAQLAEAGRKKLEEFRKRKAAEQANAAAAPQLSQATEQTRVPEERLNALVPAIPIPVAPTAPSAKPPEATATLDTPAPQPHAHDMHNLNLLSGKVSGIEIEQSLHLAAAPAPAAPPSEPSSWLAHPTPHHATTTTESSISGATSSTAWTVVQNPSFHETPALLKVQERSASALAPMWRGAHEAQPWEPGAAFPEAKPAWMSDHPPQSGAERNDFPSVNVSEGLTAGLDGDDMGSAGLASVDAASAEARDTSEHESGRENDPGSESTKPRSLIDHSDRASSAVSIPPGPMPKVKDFKELQLHIDELTDEKFTLQRCLEQQTMLADRLADENEALTRRLNETAARAEAAAQEAAALRSETAKARGAAANAMAERDAYEMSSREASERIKGLAAEVVALEEKLLHFRSEELRRESQREGQASPSASAAALRMLRAQVESANGDKARLEGEVEALHQTVAQLKTELRIASEAAASAPMAEDSAARPLSAGMASPTVDTSVQTDGPMNGHISPRDGRGNGIEQAHPSGGSNGAGAPSPIFDGVVDRDMVQDPASPPRPPPSALVAAAAMERFERDAAAGTPTVNGPPEGDMQMPAVPAELRSLLPALTWVPGLDDQVDPGIAPVVERIFDALEALAKEREEAAAAGVQRQQEAEALRAANAALQGRLEAMQAQLELGTQQRLAGTASG